MWFPISYTNRALECMWPLLRCLHKCCLLAYICRRRMPSSSCSPHTRQPLDSSLSVLFTLAHQMTRLRLASVHNAWKRCDNTEHAMRVAANNPHNSVWLVLLTTTVAKLHIAARRNVIALASITIFEFDTKSIKPFPNWRASDESFLVDDFRRICASVQYLFKIHVNSTGKSVP